MASTHSSQASTGMATPASLGRDFTYERIAQALREEIVRGDYPNGRLPTELVLSVRHHVSVGTMRKALDLLVAEDVIVRRRGSGTYVNARFNQGQPVNNSRRTHLIGYISCTGAESSLGNFFNRLMIGVHQSVERSGYALAVAHIQDGKLPMPIARQKVDGLLIAGTYWGPGGRRARRDGLSENQKLVQQAVDTGLPVVSISNPSELPGLHRVNMDYDAALHQALSVLKAHGHRDVAVFGGPAYWPAFGQRIEAFVRQCRALGLPADASNQCIYDTWADLDDARVTQDVASLLQRRRDLTAGIVISGRPDVVIAGIEQAGRRYPEDFSLISFTDIFRQDVTPQELANAARDIPSGMSTLEMPVARMAQQAVDRLVAMLEGRSFSSAQTQMFVDMAWTLGPSVRMCSTG